MDLPSAQQRLQELKEAFVGYDRVAFDSSSLWFLGYLDFFCDERAGWKNGAAGALNLLRSELELTRGLVNLFKSDPRFVFPDEVQKEYSALHEEGGKLLELRRSGKKLRRSRNQGRRGENGWDRRLPPNILMDLSSQNKVLNQLIEGRRNVVRAMNPLERVVGLDTYGPVLSKVHGLVTSCMGERPSLQGMVLEGTSADSYVNDEVIFAKVLGATSQGKVALVQNDRDYVFMLGLAGTRREEFRGLPVDITKLSLYNIRDRGVITLTRDPFGKYRKILSGDI